MADKKEKVGFFGSIKNFFKGIVKRFKDVKSENWDYFVNL